MAFSSLLLFLALLIVVAFFVARPLMEEGEEDDAMDAHASHWIAERERILDALAELDADWQMGKVPENIYSSQRQQLLAKGTKALMELDIYAEKRGKHMEAQRGKGDDIEALIAAYKAKRKRRN
ncbi:MAG: hypothetical protein WEA61_03590 [Anaerolineales bacterium]